MKFHDGKSDKAAGQRENLEASSWFAVVHSYLECSRRYAQMLEHFGITATQFDVLYAIDSLGDAATPKAIADRLVVTKANISGVIKRLSDRGLVSTHISESDSRSYYCQLTNKGTGTLVDARNSSRRFISAQLAPFSTQELSSTESLMRRMRQHLLTLNPEAIASGAD